MTKADHSLPSASSGSALVQIAQHEKSLLDKIAETRSEAQQIVESARAESAALDASELDSLEADTTDRRVRAAYDREVTRSALLSEAEQENAKARVQAESRVAIAAQEVVAMLLPHATGKEHAS